MDPSLDGLAFALLMVAQVLAVIATRTCPGESAFADHYKDLGCGGHAAECAPHAAQRVC